MKRFFSFLERALSKIVSLVLFLLLFLVIEQVFARYIFNKSSVAMQELQWHFFGIIILLGAPLTIKKDYNVRVDIFYSKFSKKTQALLNSLAILLIILPTTIIIAYKGIFFVKDSLDFKNYRPSDYYSKSICPKNSICYATAHSIEKFLRKTILIGEISSDPGGLEARWIIKAFIPFGFFLAILFALEKLFINLKTYTAIKSDK